MSRLKGDPTMRSLTKQHEIFCTEVASGKSLKESYQKAYPRSLKWRDNAVYVQASRLADRPNIDLRIKELKAKFAEKIQEKALIEAKDIISFHANVIKSDIKDYLSFGTVNKITMIGDTPIVTQDIGITLKDSGMVDGRLIKKVSQTNTGGFSFELYGKMDSLKEMARIMGLYEDKASILFPEPLQVNTAQELSTEQLEEMLKIYMGLGNDTTK